jgi:ADP-ribosylglycohydrolase
MLFFAYKYGHDPENCLLKSANAGGENVNRGNVLGALLGTVHGVNAWKP